MQRIRAIFTLYFFGAVLAAQTAAADEMPSPVPVPADTASLPAAADQQEGASEAIVEPLEIWIPRAARTPVKAATVSPTAAKTVEPTLSPEEREAAEERALLEELLKRRQPKQEHLDDAVPVENRIVLDRTHKRRLAHAAKRRGQVIRKQQRFLRKLQVKQTRGPREVRLCSLNVELFRPLASRKGVREKAWKLYKRRERAYVRAITQNHCTVVAIQRLYGSNYSDAASGIQILARSLERATKSRWEGRAGGTAKGFEHNAFLVQMHN
ncbi:MAG TPA: hypothetical protein PLP17_03980, partial [Oligoflexia bacterium]|nr:hypothetical protein [Oligoflexia bacterium]